MCGLESHGDLLLNGGGLREREREPPHEKFLRGGRFERNAQVESSSSSVKGRVPRRSFGAAALPTAKIEPGTRRVEAVFVRPFFKKHFSPLNEKFVCFLGVEKKETVGRLEIKRVCF